MENEKELAVKAQGGAGREAGNSNQPSDQADSPEAATATQAASAPPELAAGYEKLLAEKKGLYDRLLRKQAELENVRKRTQHEKEEFRQYAAEDLIRSLLPTLDSFERALKHREANVPASIYQGMEMIYRELQGVLGRAGLVAIETGGKLFDPHLHQAVETVEAKDRRDQEIVEELQRGYKLKHRLLRPAIVKVAVAPKPTPAEQPAESTRSQETAGPDGPEQKG